MTIDNPNIDEFISSTNFEGRWYDIDGKASEPMNIPESLDTEKSMEEWEKSGNVAYAMSTEMTMNGHFTPYYHCLFYRGKLFDPTGIDHGKAKKAEFKLVKVEVFDLYKDFLVTKNKTSLIHAERKLVDV